MANNYKDFANNTVLTADDVDNYLMRQSVVKVDAYSDLATLTTTSASTVVVAYNNADDQIYVYSAAGWASIGTYVGTSAPANPAVGALWYNPNNDPFFCDLKAGTATTLTTAATFYPIAFDTATEASTGMWSSGANSRITITQSGLYEVKAGVGPATSATEATFDIALFINGANTDTTLSRVSVNLNAGWTTAILNKYVRLTSGQYIQIHARSSIAGMTTPTATATKPFFQARYVIA